MPRLTDYDLAVYRRRNGEPDLPLPPKPRKSQRREESRIQCALLVWWSTACRDFQVWEGCLFSIPNGGWRDPVGAAILKREGQRNGVSDLFLMVARGPYHGLFLEMKTPAGKPSADQHRFLAEAARQKYAAFCSYGFDAAVKTITGYLNGEDIF